MNRGSGGGPGLLVPILAPANSAKIVGNSEFSFLSIKWNKIVPTLYNCRVVMEIKTMSST